MSKEICELAIRIEGTREFLHRSPGMNRQPAGKRGREYLTTNLADARRFTSLSSAESYARRMKRPFNEAGMKNCTFEIIEIEYVIGQVSMRI